MAGVQKKNCSSDNFSCCWCTRTGAKLIIDPLFAGWWITGSDEHSSSAMELILHQSEPEVYFLIKNANEMKIYEVYVG